MLTWPTIKFAKKWNFLLSPHGAWVKINGVEYILSNLDHNSIKIHELVPIHILEQNLGTILALK